MTEEDEKVLNRTMANLCASVRMQDANISKLIGIIGAMQERISALEKARATKPAILNPEGVRLN